MSAEDRLAYWKRRARDAERRLEFEVERSEHTREWAQDAFKEERRLADRCTFLYGMAIKHGATPDSLRDGLLEVEGPR